MESKEKDYPSGIYTCVLSGLCLDVENYISFIGKAEIISFFTIIWKLPPKTINL